MARNSQSIRGADIRRSELGRRCLPHDSSSRTLSFHLGFVVRISSAAGSKRGATIASTNRPGSASTSAVAASTGAIESQHGTERAQRIAVQRPPRGDGQIPAVAAPQGLLCLMTDTAGCGSDRTIASALSRSSRLLYDSSLPLSWRASINPAAHRPALVRTRPPAGADSRRSAALPCACSCKLSEVGNAVSSARCRCHQAAIAAS